MASPEDPTHSGSEIGFNAAAKLKAALSESQPETSAGLAPVIPLNSEAGQNSTPESPDPNPWETFRVAAAQAFADAVTFLPSEALGLRGREYLDLKYQLAAENPEETTTVSLTISPTHQGSHITLFSETSPGAKVWRHIDSFGTDGLREEERLSLRPSRQPLSEHVNKKPPPAFCSSQAIDSLPPIRPTQSRNTTGKNQRLVSPIFSTNLKT